MPVFPSDASWLNLPVTKQDEAREIYNMLFPRLILHDPENHLIERVQGLLWPPPIMSGCTKQMVVDLLVGRGTSVATLRWLVGNGGLHPSPRALMGPMHRKDFPMIVFLLDHDVQFPRADIDGSLGLGDLMRQQDHLDQLVATGALTLRVPADEYGLVPRQKSVDEAAGRGYQGVLKAVHDKYGRIPTEKGADGAAANGHLGVLEWLAAFHGIYPTEKGADGAAANGHLEVLKWLGRNNRFPSPDVVDTVAAAGHLGVLDFLLSMDDPMIPSQTGLDRARRNGHAGVLQWLASYRTDRHHFDDEAVFKTVERLIWENRDYIPGFPHDTPPPHTPAALPCPDPDFDDRGEDTDSDDYDDESADDYPDEDLVEKDPYQGSYERAVLNPPLI